jgi:hypothetical protein
VEAIADGLGVHMGGGDSEDSEEGEDERMIADYNRKSQGLFMLYSASSPRRFVRKLTEYLLESKGVAATIDDTIWMLKFTIEAELDDVESAEGV